MSRPDTIRLVEAELITGSAAMVEQLARMLDRDYHDDNALDFAGLLRAVQVLRKDAEWVAKRFEEVAVENHELRKQLEGGE